MQFIYVVMYHEILCMVNLTVTLLCQAQKLSVHCVKEKATGIGKTVSQPAQERCGG
jgi:hypothetical protein